MKFRQFLQRSLRFYWRTNLAVVLGVVAATAAIGGALVVGDSVRDSLKRMTLERLGRVDHAVSGGRYFREDLANEFADDGVVAAPALLMPGTLIHESTEPQSATPRLLRAGQVQVIGTDERLWSLLETGDVPRPNPGEIVINRRVAEQLQAGIGESLSIIVEVPKSIPRDSLLGDRDETVTELPGTVTAILEDVVGASRFGLNPSQQIPLLAYVSLDDLQSQVGLEQIRRSRRNPVAKPARVNSIFFSSTAPQPLEQIGPERAEQITQSLAKQITLEDLALRIVRNERHGTLSLESEQLILENSISETAIDIARQLQARVSPVLVYILNEIRSAEHPDRYSMYSIIAGIDPQLPEPFGPFDFVGEHRLLAPGDVYVNDWLAQDLDVATGDQIDVKYHVVGDRGELPEVDQSFTVAGVVKLSGVADDMGYTPNVPGVTDAETYADWRKPFPMKDELITDRDNLYWDNTDTEREDDYRTTPKLFTSLETAQAIWGSRYGNLTSVRMAPPAGTTLEAFQQQFETEFLQQLEPTQTGLIVQPVKAAGLQAAQGTTDFTGLFIGFSFFLILAATILVGLLFRLGVESRLSQLGLFIAVGLTPRQVRRLFLCEGGVLVVCGGILGTCAAVGYAQLMIYGLKTWWYGAIGTRFLSVSIHPGSLILGFVIAVGVALLAVFWALRQTGGQSTRRLLNGESTSLALATVQQTRQARRMAQLLCGSSILLMLATVFGLVPDAEAFSGFSWRVVTFFLVGTGMLCGGLYGLAAALGAHDAIRIEGSTSAARFKLGLRNAARNRSRSVLSTSLIAFATFVIVAVGAGQQDPTGIQPDVDSGNGGFTLVAETNVPLLNDVNSPQGRSKLGFDVLDQQLMSTLDQARVMPFRMRPGENASCLNLYQTQLPTILGVPEDVLTDMIEKHRFQFANTPADQPWKLIDTPLESGNVPVLGDMNTLMYSLHKGIGETIAVPNEEDAKHRLEIVGMFANSIFQGVLVMSEANFKQVFPEQVGYQYFLIETPLESTDEVASVLELHLGDYGFDAERVSDRLADFLAVQNTYLSTFQTLGGLGLLLGTIGMATVMLRNVLERRGELALLRAIGFRAGQLGLLVVLENLFLLTCGLTLGAVSAMLAMGPHLISSGSAVPWPSLVQLLIGVFVVGMASAVFAVRVAVTTPILSTLRGE